MLIEQAWSDRGYIKSQACLKGGERAWVSSYLTCSPDHNTNVIACNGYFLGRISMPTWLYIVKNPQHEKTRRTTITSLQVKMTTSPIFDQFKFWFTCHPCRGLSCFHPMSVWNHALVDMASDDRKGYRHNQNISTI